MIVLPASLKRFQKEAKDCLAASLARDVEFSGGTYQILVVDPKTKKEEWAFLQLDAQGRLKDSFCSCEQSESGRGCLHQAAAFLRIYEDRSLPLHQRFERSLWNQLCRSCSYLMGDRPDQLKATRDGRYVCRAPNGKIIFSIQAKTSAARTHLENLFFQRQQETEETSLKFSNLSETDLALWEQGKPSPQLAYELSFWSDLGKWLIQLQETSKSYTIEFDYSKKLPTELSVSFPDLTASWALNEDNLPAIIPSLATVKSPLAVRTESTEAIEKILYDKAKKTFVIAPKKGKKDFHSELKHPKGTDLGDWVYIPDQGFYSKQTCFLGASASDLGDIEKLLNEHTAIIKELISGLTVRETPVPVSYSLTFDKNSNLHVQTYLFSPGDLSTLASQPFGAWVYLEDRGFYRWEGRYFDEIETIVPASDVSDFVSQHRTWLNTQEGFHTHLNPLSADLNYRLNDDNYLVFSRNLAYHEEMIGSKDFGRWVYIPGQGFFSKASIQANLPIRAGTTIPPDQISLFIHANKEELDLIRGFFGARLPVAKAKLNVKVISSNQVQVSPEYEFLPEYQNQPIRIFDDFSYVEEEGFCELVGNARLPERFRQPMIIEGDRLAHFILHELESLKPFLGTVDPRLQKPLKTSLIAEEIEVEEGEGKRNYVLKLDYETDLGVLSLSSIWTAFHKHQRFIFSDSGLIDLSDKRFGWLKHLGKRRIDRRSNKLRLSPLELLRLNATEEISVIPAARHSKELLRELVEFRAPEESDLTGLKSELRPYQKLGFKWLWFLYHHGLSGLLCDDMGLGKTHQAMALMAAISNKQKDQPSRHFLVVCPTSVIYHWQEKLSMYLPTLKVWTFHGSGRTLENFQQDYDILLTSYGIWRNEADRLHSVPFEVAVFDELQIAKNQTSRIYSALLKANARMRLGMTGTPIENRLRELKALFDIVLPTYMPSESDYREMFIRPIEKEGDFDRKRLLNRLVKPFVLRRKKEDVLIDLPEKTEEIAHCDLMPEQKQLYIDVLAASRDKLIEELQDSQTPIPYMHIFSLLSQLKQICNHPAVYLKRPSEYKKYQSGKWELFLELLEEARESGQKVVVFSHYLSMLDIINDYLKEHGIGFAEIRGATVDRGEQLRRFNTDPQCEVFLASLQAAGLGVDLTAGSVVIHYDRWWNAARENQATDRVHRIGQTRGVQVFKLMTKGTLEEHIDFLISKKGRLLEDVVSVDDHQTIKKFERQEIISLLQTMP